MTVQVQQGVRIDISMEVGAVSQTVEVTGETPLLQPTSSSLGQVVEQRETNEIPLNGRNVFNLITLSPAAVAQGGAGGTPVGQNPFSWGNYQVGGSFANESAEYLDGQPLNIGYINLPIIIPTQDSIAEFKVQYNNLGAEWGKFSGGVVNLSTKSGSNQFHAEAYEYLRNKVLNATPYFTSTNPPYVQNQYGVAGGGPIIKDKTFFYASWEQFRLRQGGSTSTTTVPLPQMFGIGTPGGAGDFSSLCPGITAGGFCTPAEIAAGRHSALRPLHHRSYRSWSTDEVPRQHYSGERNQSCGARVVPEAIPLAKHRWYQQWHREQLCSVTFNWRQHEPGGGAWRSEHQ